MHFSAKSTSNKESGRLIHSFTQLVKENTLNLSEEDKIVENEVFDRTV